MTMKPFLSASALCLSLCITVHAETIGLFYNAQAQQHVFAAGDIRSALEAKKHTVEVKDLADLAESYSGKKIVIGLASDATVKAVYEAQGDRKSVV